MLHTQVVSPPRQQQRAINTKIYAAKREANPSDPLRSGRGYINKDNSGRSNIFGTVPDKLYVSSPTSDRVARSGLGGLQGIAMLGVAVTAVVVITTGVLRFEDGDDLKSVGVVMYTMWDATSPTCACNPLILYSHTGCCTAPVGEPDHLGTAFT